MNRQVLRHLISYLFFGVCTTLCNVIFYGLFTRAAGWSTLPATWGAWFLAVVFAFVTNKRYVFGSRSLRWKILGREAAAFFCCRLITGRGSDVCDGRAVGMAGYVHEGIVQWACHHIKLCGQQVDNF